MKTCAVFPLLIFAIQLPALCGEQPQTAAVDTGRVETLVAHLTTDYSQRYTEAMKELARLHIPVLLAVTERERAARDRDVVNRLRAARWSVLDQGWEKLQKLVKQGSGKALLPMFVWDLKSAGVFRRSYHAYQPADALRMVGAEAVPTLIQALRIGQEPVPDLAAAMREGKDPYTRASAAKVLGEIGPVSEGIVPALEKLLRDLEPHVREAAARALGKMGAVARDAVPSLVAALRDGEARVGHAAAEALGEIGGPALRQVVAALS
ncbi:MAG: HEAT repeat domain-containing protein, partial [Planctomycetota bacterium]